jgi:hypothetical protein
MLASDQHKTGNDAKTYAKDTASILWPMMVDVFKARTLYLQVLNLSVVVRVELPGGRGVNGVLLSAQLSTK